ncbi:gamma-glutamylcyclotransferase [Spirosoma luteolum]
MNTESVYLFVYGTLLPTFANPYAYKLTRQARYVGPGQLRGALYDLGSYPGAIFDPASEQVILGAVYALNDPSNALLRDLDDYEAVGSNNPTSTSPDEYIRRQCPVWCIDHWLQSWVYLYNHPLTTAIRIDSGDYVAWQARSDTKKNTDL